MILSFEKWHGCLNDFIVTWISDLDGDLVLDSIKRQAQLLCDRHAGVGADGVLVLRTKMRDELTPDRIVIINSDGSLANNCGNGLRCAALSVLKRHQERGNPQELPELVELLVQGYDRNETKYCRFLPGRSGGWPLVSVEMGIPVLNQKVTWYDDARETVKRLAKEQGLADLTTDFGVVEIGNPHIVLNSEDASRELMLKLGRLLQTSSAWDGMNVHLVRAEHLSDKDQTRAGSELGQRLSELYTAFVWERGAGETMACGSGACAIAAVAIQTGLVEREAWIGVDMPGGRLYIKSADDDDSLTLAGSGTFVFSGSLSI